MFSRHFCRHRTARHRALFIGLALACLGATSATAGGNLVVNPGFDRGLDGWQSFGAASWDPTHDAGGSAASGSALLQVDIPPFEFPGSISQCVPLAVGVTYRAGGDVFIAPGQTSTGSGYFAVTIFPQADCQGPPPPITPGVQTPPVAGPGFWTASTTVFTSFGLSAAISTQIAAASGSNFAANFDNVVVAPLTPTCTPDSSTLCLETLRFRVSTQFDLGDGEGQLAHAVPIGDSSGYQWFFSPDNLETMVKIFDGCGLGGNYWFFAAGLTNVHVHFTVTDTTTGAQRVYDRPAGTAFQPIQDTAAFPCL